MSDFNEFAPSETDDGKGLRSKLEGVLAQLKTVSAELETAKAERAQASLKNLFDELGVPEKVRKFYSGDADPAQVKTWVDENKDVFNLTVPASTGEATVDPEVQAQVNAVQKANDLGSDIEGSLLSNAQAVLGELTKSRPSRNPAALNEALAQLGISQGGYSAQSVQ